MPADREVVAVTAPAQ